MKKLKFNKAPIIGLLVSCAIFLVVGIVFAFLPEEIYISWGDDDSARTRYYPLIICGVVDIVLLLIVWLTAVSQKRSINKINAFMQNIGEDAIALNGSIVDREAARENAAKTALSVIGGVLSALFLGVGFYKIYGKNNARIFILYSEGMYVIDTRTKTQIQFNKMNVKDIKITEKRKSIVVELIPSIVTFTVKTKGLDISTEELIARFKEVFTNPIIDPYRNL